MRGEQRLRYFWSMLRRGSRYNRILLEKMNRRFWNNGEKILGWQDGYPLVSFLSPLSFSPPQAQAMTTKLAGILQGRILPDMANVAVTDTCDCACPFCSFRSIERKQSCLSTEELQKLIDDIQTLGVTSMILTGGEPLMREDIMDVVSHIDSSRSYISMFTNGIRLSAAAKDLRKAGLNTIMVSFPSDNEEEHDRIKGRKGAWRASVEGLNAARKAGLLTGISLTVYAGDTENGRMERIFQTAKDLGVNGVLVFDAVPTGALSGDMKSVCSAEEQREVIRICGEFNRKTNYPGILSYTHLKSPGSVGCSGGTSFFYVSPYGDVGPCDFNPMSVGNVRETTLPLLWERFRRDPEFRSSGLNGCRMQDPDFHSRFREHIASRTFPGAECDN